MRDELLEIMRHLKDAQALANKADQRTVAMLIQSAIDEINDRLEATKP